MNNLLIFNELIFTFLYHYKSEIKLAYFLYPANNNLMSWISQIELDDKGISIIVTLKNKCASHFFGYSSSSTFKQNLPERYQKAATMISLF